MSAFKLSPKMKQDIASSINDAELVKVIKGVQVIDIDHVFAAVEYAISRWLKREDASDVLLTDFGPVRLKALMVFPE